MGKKALNIIETFLILLIALICIVSILQSTLFQNKNIFGYHTYVIASNSMYPVLKYGDVVLVKETDFNTINKGDIITYYGKEGEVKDKIITHEVIDIIKENDTTVLKTKGRANTGVDPYVYKDQVYGEFVYRFTLLSLLSKIIRDKIGFIICILIPFSILFILEFISVTKEVKRKTIEDIMTKQLEELNSIDDKSDLSNAIKKAINDKLEEIKDAKRDFKKIDNLQETIHIPLEEIKYQINELSKKKTPKEMQKENKLLEDTMFISNNIDINEAIEKELKTKEKKSKKKPTKKKTNSKKEK
ncbi:MAG: signal peptidase I [Bacilli bacterium]|nr:signal peptidase I [Bacilli bacterium]